jgi:asparagine synthase (glutamine-hydrolysing)
MCGIFASVGFEPDQHCIDIVSHRGPDGQGWIEFESGTGPVCLGHRRLAIIDLDARSNQPMSCDDGRFWLTFNGEIYNFIELRDELIGRGVAFNTTSDSEVLLQAYAAWGEAALQKLRGMFAFVIYDRTRQTLFAARDRFGIKPLYYFVAPQGVAFASEIKQLVDLPGFTRRLNLERAVDYLDVGFTDHTEETMFADARQLRGGQCLTLDLRTWRRETVAARRYYELPRQPLQKMSEAEAAHRFRDLFADAVRLHLRSDVRVGSCLSGGLDSSSIVAMMALLRRATGDDGSIQTVTACYRDRNIDERPYAAAAAAAAQAEPHYVYPTAQGVFDIAERLTWHQDEPQYNTSMYAQWCVFEEARRQGVKVMLDGQGADEQLAGYHYDAFPVQSGALARKGDVFGFLHMLLERKIWHGHPIVGQLLTVPNRPRLPRFARRWRTRRQGVAASDRLSPSVASAHRPAAGVYAATLERDEVEAVDDIGGLCVANLLGLSLPKLLRYEDRNSMAHSIEARLPFLDHPLVEFCIGLWDQHKIIGGDTKRVLRASMQGIVPSAILTRRDKIGFATPQQDWFRGEIRQAMQDGVHETLRRFPDLFDRQTVVSYLNAAMAGERPADQGLWMLVNFGIWGRRFQVGM